MFRPSGESNRFLHSPARAPLPVGSALHSWHSPADATVPGPVGHWHGPEQPPQLSPHGISPQGKHCQGLVPGKGQQGFHCCSGAPEARSLFRAVVPREHHGPGL